MVREERRREIHRLFTQGRSGRRPEIIDSTLQWSLSLGPSGSVDLAAFFANVGA